MGECYRNRSPVSKGYKKCMEWAPGKEEGVTVGERRQTHSSLRRNLKNGRWGSCKRGGFRWGVDVDELILP